DDSIAQRHCREAQGAGASPRAEHEQADRRTQRADAGRMGYGEALSCRCGHRRRPPGTRGPRPPRCCGSRLKAGHGERGHIRSRPRNHAALSSDASSLTTTSAHGTHTSPYGCLSTRPCPISLCTSACTLEREIGDVPRLLRPCQGLQRGRKTITPWVGRQASARFRAAVAGSSRRSRSEETRLNSSHVKNSYV